LSEHPPAANRLVFSVWEKLGLLLICWQASGVGTGVGIYTGTGVGLGVGVGVMIGDGAGIGVRMGVLLDITCPAIKLVRFCFSVYILVAS